MLRLLQNIMKFSLLDFKRDHLELKAHNAYIQVLGKVDSEDTFP